MAGVLFGIPAGRKNKPQFVVQYFHRRKIIPIGYPTRRDYPWVNGFLLEAVQTIGGVWSVPPLRIFRFVVRPI
jgi:hypothetical protein